MTTNVTYVPQANDFRWRSRNYNGRYLNTEKTTKAWRLICQTMPAAKMTPAPRHSLVTTSNLPASPTEAGKVPVNFHPLEYGDAWRTRSRSSSSGIDASAYYLL